MQNKNGTMVFGMIIVALLSIALLDLKTAKAFDKKSDVTDDNIVQIRRLQMFKKAVAEPFPQTECNNKVSDDTCLLGLLNYALSSLYIDERNASISGSEALDRALVRILLNKEWKRRFHFMQASILYRTLRLFGRKGMGQPGKLTAANEDTIRLLFLEYYGSQCTNVTENNESRYLVWASENHAEQRDGACWAAASILNDESSDRARNDQVKIDRVGTLYYYNKVIKANISNKVKFGGFIEYFSPTYAQYSLSVLYNYFDFSDDSDLKKLSANALELWWCLWAEEQTNGNHGGSKARAYISVAQSASAMRQTAYLYFGFKNLKNAITPGEVFSYTSSFYPTWANRIILAKQTDVQSYMVRHKVIGKQLLPFGNDTYTMDTNLAAVNRISSIGPGFVMGSASLDLKIISMWADISSQNRWNGVVFSSSPQSKVSIQVMPEGGKSAYNGMTAIQNESIQVIRKLEAPYSKNAGKLAIWFGRTLELSELAGWIIVDDSAYTAIRPAWGGYTWNKTKDFVAIPNDQAAPLVMYVQSKNNFKSVEEFYNEVRSIEIKANRRSVDFFISESTGQKRHFSSLNEERFVRLDSSSEDFTIFSPFIRQVRRSSNISLNAMGKTETLDFSLK